MVRFSIRDLLWLTALAALALCWWLDHRRLSQQVHNLKESIKLISPGMPPHVLDSLKKPP
ncbi:MAG TPA: hypothetical protein VFB96_11875 [Pirellulaceae bacterium]|nr:hypothetical protein [Pirellulaceae bacterium]